MELENQCSEQMTRKEPRTLSVGPVAPHGLPKWHQIEWYCCVRNDVVHREEKEDCQCYPMPPKGAQATILHQILPERKEAPAKNAHSNSEERVSCT